MNSVVRSVIRRIHGAEAYKRLGCLCGKARFLTSFVRFDDGLGEMANGRLKFYMIWGELTIDEKSTDGYWQSIYTDRYTDM